MRINKFLRPICAVFLGVFTYYYFNNATIRGVIGVSPDSYDSYWTPFYSFKDKYFIRFIFDLVIVFPSGFIVGLCLRKKNIILGLLAISPGLLFKCVGLYSAFIYTFDPLIVENNAAALGNKIFQSLGVLLSPFVMILGLVIGSSMGDKFGQFFDGKKYSCFGIKWYHYLWLYFYGTLMVMVASIFIYISLVTIKIIFNDLRRLYDQDVSIFWPILGLFFSIYPLVLLCQSYGKAYIYLSGYNLNITISKRFGMLLLYIFIFPALLTSARYLLEILIH
jgi:hypothetical protein